MGDNWERGDAGRSGARPPLATVEGYPTSRPAAPGPKRRVVVAGLVLLAVATLLAVLLRAPLAGFFAGRPHAAGTPAPTGPTAPAFSDWRVAYVGSDGALHIVPLDGQTDSVGNLLPNLPAATDSSDAPLVTSASASPTGQAVAYTNGTLMIVHLRPGAPYAFTGIKDTASDLAWSADGSQLAYGDRTNRVVVIRYPSTDERVYPLASPQAATSARVQPLGWRDASHVVVAMGVSSGVQFDALDITSGQTQPIATLPSAGLGTLWYDLSPDGSSILIGNSAQGQDHAGVRPFIAVIATTTGQMRTLHSPARLVGSGIASAAWKPGTTLVAVASSGTGSAGPPIELLDTAHDTLRPLGASGFPQVWTPDGSRLIASSAGSAQPGDSPHAIVALTVPATGAPTAVTLTTAAMAFPLLGLVHTA